MGEISVEKSEIWKFYNRNNSRNEKYNNWKENLIAQQIRHCRGKKVSDLKNGAGDFPGGPMAKNLPSSARAWGLISRQGTKDPIGHEARPKTQKQKH